MSPKRFSSGTRWMSPGIPCWPWGSWCNESHQFFLEIIMNHHLISCQCLYLFLHQKDSHVLSWHSCSNLDLVLYETRCSMPRISFGNNITVEYVLEEYLGGHATCSQGDYEILGSQCMRSATGWANCRRLWQPCENHCEDHCLSVGEGHHQCPKDVDNQVF